MKVRVPSGYWERSTLGFSIFPAAFAEGQFSVKVILLSSVSITQVLEAVDPIEGANFSGNLSPALTLQMHQNEHTIGTT